MKIIRKTHVKFLPLLFIGAASFFTSCSKDNSKNNAPAAKVKIVNTVDGSASQDLYLDNVKINSSAVAYAQSSDYFNATSGNHNAKFTNSGSTTATVAFNVSLQADSSYTIYFTSTDTVKSSFVAVDNLVAPAANKAKVRFINLSNAAATSVDFGTSATAKLVTNLAYKAISAYNQVDANTSFYLFASGSASAMLNIPATVQAGKIYTIYVTGSSTLDLSYHVVVEN